MNVIFSGTAAGWVSARFWRGHTPKHTRKDNFPTLFLNEVFIDTEHLEQERQRCGEEERQRREVTSHMLSRTLSRRNEVRILARIMIILLSNE